MLARCAHCRNTFETDRFGVQICPHCGSQVLLSDPNAPAAPPPPPAGAPPPAAGGAEPSASAPPPPPGPPPAGWVAPGGGWAPPPPPPEQSAPFARRREVGPVRGWIETFRLAAFDPKAFFRSVKTGESRSAVLFGVIAITLAQWFEAAFGYFTSYAWQGTLQDLLRRIPQASDGAMLRLYLGGTAAAFVARLVLAPLYALVALFVIAGVVHGFLVLFRGANRGFDATITTVGYASGIQVLGVLPVCGALIGLVWFTIVLIIGLGEAQRCGPGKAAAATLLPGALACACACGSLAALMSAFTGMGRQHGVTI